MEIVDTVAALRALQGGWGRVALVPTMGALHRGHLALVEAARARAERVVVSIFVNPTQFGDPQDLAAYPRTLEADAALLRGAGVDAAFAPSVAEMYPEGAETVVDLPAPGSRFHGAVRPGHFRGVATVVCKLLNAARPDWAMFGEKDYQQLFVVRRMARDLLMPVEIVGVPTVREPDGLALSSRNARLAPEARAKAPVLFRALRRAAEAMKDGQRVERAALDALHLIAETADDEGARVDVVDAGTFEVASGPLLRRVGLMASARFGDVLLIDQLEVEP